MPFSFIPVGGGSGEPAETRKVTLVRAIPERKHLAITFPRLVGNRYDLGEERIEAKFSADLESVLSTQQIPTKVEVAGVIGPHAIHTLDELRKKRDQEVVFFLAKLVLENYFRDEEAALKPWLFPQVLHITGEWYRDRVRCKDNTFKQLLYFTQFALSAAELIYKGIAAAEMGTHRLVPILHPYDVWASTDDVEFDTTRPVYETRADRCHVSHVVADGVSWERKMAQSLEEMDEVVCYVKNDRQPGFTIPYVFEGNNRSYYPDFVARVREGHGDDDLLNLVIEVSGERRDEKDAKVTTAQNLWVPAVNNHGGLGRWAFAEVRDPWDAQTYLRRVLAALPAATTLAPAD